MHGLSPCCSTLKWVGLVGKKAVLAFFLILFVSKVFVLSVQEWLETKIVPLVELNLIDE